MWTTAITTASRASGDSYTSVRAEGRRGSSGRGCRKFGSCPGHRGRIHSRHNTTTMSTPKKRSTFGRLWRAAVLGVADGIPGLSQVVTAIEHFKDPKGVPVGPRLVVGWTTVAMMGMLIAARIWGGFGWDELIKLLGLLAAF